MALRILAVLVLLAPAGLARAQGYPDVPPPTPAPPPGPQIPVRFEAAQAGEAFTVSVDGGAAVETPCDLPLAPGRHLVAIGGAGSFKQRLEVPPEAVSVGVERRSKGLMALGIAGTVLAVLGLEMLLAPLEELAIDAVVAVANRTSVDTSQVTASRYFGFIPFVPLMVAGASALAVGATGAGIGLAKMGHNRLTIRPERRAEAGPTLVGVAVGPTRGGGGLVGATFAF